ncbi:hypothetical protein M885DRAFT_610734 [Pelagophyceae sp. CCMP2097]|nr:hypothetical protein M885DRAFT_610734 [Pelagophyceae sp. CCMP2097]
MPASGPPQLVYLYGFVAGLGALFVYVVFRSAFATAAESWIEMAQMAPARRNASDASDGLEKKDFDVEAPLLPKSFEMAPPSEAARPRQKRQHVRTSPRQQAGQAGKVAPAAIPLIALPPAPDVSLRAPAPAVPIPTEGVQGGWNAHQIRAEIALYLDRIPVSGQNEFRSRLKLVGDDLDALADLNDDVQTMADNR